MCKPQVWAGWGALELPLLGVSVSQRFGQCGGPWSYLCMVCVCVSQRLGLTSVWCVSHRFEQDDEPWSYLCLVCLYTGLGGVGALVLPLFGVCVSHRFGQGDGPGLTSVWCVCKPQAWAG